MTRHDDLLYLRHMIEAAQKARLFVRGKTREDYDRDEVLRIALVHLVQTVGEAARNVSQTTQADNPNVPWKQVMGIRHRIVHNYADIDEDIIRKTVIDDLPPLISALDHLLPSEGQNDVP